MNSTTILVLAPGERNAIYPLPLENLGMCALAASIRQSGCECHMLDGFLFGLSEADFLSELDRRIREYRIGVLGISVMAEEFVAASLRTAAWIKREHPDLRIIAGGPYPTFRPLDLLTQCPEMDAILRGEADYTVVLWLRAAEEGRAYDTVPGCVYRQGGTIRHGPYPFDPPRVEQLPEPARDFALLAGKGDGWLSMSTSRGCDYRCAFCGIPGFSGRRRERSAAAVVAEAERLSRQYGPTRITFVDPTIVGTGESSRRRFREIGEGLRQLQLPVRFTFELRSDLVRRDDFEIWKDAGLETVHLGVESAFPPTLSRFRKGEGVEANAQAIDCLRELGIAVTASFITFHPWTSPEEIRSNVEFLMRHGIKNGLSPLFNTLRLYAGTPLLGRWHGPASPVEDPAAYFVSPAIAKFFAEVTAPGKYREIVNFVRAGSLLDAYECYLRTLDAVEPAASS